MKKIFLRWMPYKNGDWMNYKWIVKIESKNELKESNVKNRACFCFDDVIDGTDINFSDILLNKKVYENTSVYGILYKISAGPKPLRIRFDKIDGLIMPLDG